MNQFEHSNLSDTFSFHGHSVHTSKDDLEKVCGKVMFTDNDLAEDVKHVWEMQSEDGTLFTIYDYKEYREYPSNEKIDWHIGANNRFGAKKGYDEIKRGFHLHPKINYNL